MAEPPPRTPPEPSEDETVVAGDWPVRPEGQVVVEHSETVPPRRRLPVIWPWLLALLVLVLAGLAAAYFITRDDDEPAATTTAATTTAATTDTTAAVVRVPDVVGTTSSEATATLRDAGFEANVVAVPSDRPSGQVVAQNPAAGSDAPEGSTVRLNVAQAATETTTPATTAPPPATTAPPEPATVPEVVGDELADAAEAFGDEGLKVAVMYVPSNEPQGRVVAQAQPPGTERKRGDTVQVNVSTGPEPAPATEVPDVAGTRESEARTSLERAGFEVLDIEFEGNRSGIVISQSPRGGASIPRGSLVILYVGA